MTMFFTFEAEFVESLRCIPMQVRYKLDTCGVKLKLQHWHQLTPDQRQQLVASPCDTPDTIAAYREQLQQWVTEATGSPAGELAIDPNPAWRQIDTVPESVQTKAAEFQVTIAPSQWASLTPLQRFALIKLSRAGHENLNFWPALQEFALA
ncbi:nitrate reductase associated protein [Trichothermofontia sp.]